jgi:hypothetical protein
MISTYKKYVVEKLTYMSGPRVAMLFGSLLLAVLLVVSLGARAAWSADFAPRFSPANGFLDFKALSLKSQSSPPLVLTDQCLPLLNSVVLSPTSVSGPNQRPAGTAAALGLIMGLRYALSPTPPARIVRSPASSSLAELSPSSSSDTPKDHRSALAVQAYRQCQKEQALYNLQPYRWQR